MSFQLLPKLVTLDDLNGIMSIISPNLVASGAHYIKVVEDTPIFL